jgi:hypothetical protein
MIKRIALVLALTGLGAVAVGCSNSTGQTALQSKMVELWNECESKSDKNDLSCLEMRQLHRENPGIVNPAAEKNAEMLIRKSKLLNIEGEENMKKMKAAMEGLCRESAEPVDDRPLCP